jgi:hypothetical protein
MLVQSLGIFGECCRAGRQCAVTIGYAIKMITVIDQASAGATAADQ